MHKKIKVEPYNKKNLIYHFGTKLMYIFKVREEDFPRIKKKRLEIRMILNYFYFDVWVIMIIARSLL